MADIKRSGDCGNSPKNKLAEDLSVALATSDKDSILEYVSDDVSWEMIGGDTVSGGEEVAEAAADTYDGTLSKLVVEHAFTHGKLGAANGRVELKGGKTYEFCDVYEFTSTKGTSVGSIRSYRVEV